MKKLNLRLFAIYALAAIAGAALLHVSQRVQHAEERLAIINAEISEEKETIRILNAEWEYLNRPERLEKLAKEFLDLSPPQTLPASILNNTQPEEQPVHPVSYDGEDAP
ncbi:MAG: cell division protein FtsL [Alphaproteobacteria bacterium]